MNRVSRGLLAAVLVLAGCGADEPGTEDPGDQSPVPVEDEASVSFVTPEDGATVASPVQVQMAAEGVAIEPAADGVKPNSGHLHIMVDTDCVPAGEVIPADETHLHYGMAQTEAEINLSPGEHTLCLQLADAAHVATEVTDEIMITVS